MKKEDDIPGDDSKTLLHTGKRNDYLVPIRYQIYIFSFISVILSLISVRNMSIVFTITKLKSFFFPKDGTMKNAILKALGDLEL